MIRHAFGVTGGQAMARRLRLDFGPVVTSNKKQNPAPLGAGFPIQCPPRTPVRTS